MTSTMTSPRRNGVDVATLFATLDAVKEQPQIAKFQFRASNTWVAGTHSRSTISGFYGATQELEHKHVTVLDADHPAVLVGADNGPTPVEFLLHGIASSVTESIAREAEEPMVRVHAAWALTDVQRHHHDPNGERTLPNPAPAGVSGGLKRLPYGGDNRSPSGRPARR